MADGSSAASVAVISGMVGALLAKRGVTGPIGAHENLADLGLTSLDLVNLMLAVEDEFRIEIPQRQMTPANFRTIAAVEALVNAVALAA